MGTLPGTFSVLVAPQKQARAARPGAPQAPQAARSAAAGGRQQVREIKRHFRFRGFATNIKDAVKEAAWKPTAVSALAGVALPYASALEAV